MKFSIKMLAVAIAMAVLVACSSNPVSKAVPTAKSGDSSAAQAAIKAAKAAKKKSAAHDAEWRDMGKFIKKAEKLAAAGKNAEAMKLAKKVIKQGELGLAQAAAQANAGPTF